MVKRLIYCLFILVLFFGIQVPSQADEPVRALSDVEAKNLMSAFEVTSEKLVVCKVVGNPHLRIDDVIYLVRLGKSDDLQMTVLRNEGEEDESHPWTNPSGGPVIMVNPGLKENPHKNPAYVEFTPVAMGVAKVEPHDDGEKGHQFSLRRDTRADAKSPCAKSTAGDEDMIIKLSPHTSGSRHGGHAIAN